MPITDFNKQQAIFWGEFVEIAYDMYKADPTLTNPAQPNYFPPGWTLVTDLTIDPVNPVFPVREFIGFIAQFEADPTQFAVVFRGTESDLDWIGDLELWSVPFTDVPNGGRTEAGFTEMYNSVKHIPPGSSTPVALNVATDVFNNATSITVTGHSLGGALAIMYSAVFGYQYPKASLQCYTYAAPMVGDLAFVSAFQSFVNESHRIYNFPDIVPRLPGAELGYAQLPTGIEINSLTDPNIHWSIACFHSLVVYLTVLGAIDQNLGGCAVSAVEASQAVLPSATRSVPVG